MADFTPAFDKMIHNEGGFLLIDIATDQGGQTYAGIARNFHPNWPGWRYINSKDMTNPQLTALVRDFYRASLKGLLSSFQRRPESSIQKATRSSRSPATHKSATRIAAKPNSCWAGSITPSGADMNLDVPGIGSIIEGVGKVATKETPKNHLFALTLRLRSGLKALSKGWQHY